MYMNWYIEVLKKCTVFSGRAHRTEYWMFFLINFLISIALTILNLDLIGILYTLGVLIPSISVAVRRLHDTGRSGWWLLIALIPLVGAIILIVFLALEGQAEANQYGPVPAYAPQMATSADTNTSQEPVIQNETTTVTEESKEDVVINEMPQSNNTVVESHESLEEKN